MWHTVNSSPRHLAGENFGLAQWVNYTFAYALGVFPDQNRLLSILGVLGLVFVAGILGSAGQRHLLCDVRMCRVRYSAGLLASQFVLERSSHGPHDYVKSLSVLSNLVSANVRLISPPSQQSRPLLQCERDTKVV